MPRFDFVCSCGRRFEDLVQGRTALCTCGRTVTASFSPTRNLIVPEHMKAQNRYDNASNAKHRAWCESDECKKKINSGEIRYLSKGERDAIPDQQ